MANNNTNNMPIEAVKTLLAQDFINSAIQNEFATQFDEAETEKDANKVVATWKNVLEATTKAVENIFYRLKTDGYPSALIKAFGTEFLMVEKIKNLKNLATLWSDYLDDIVRHKLLGKLKKMMATQTDGVDSVEELDDLVRKLEY